MTPTTAVILVAALLTLAMGSAEATSLASSETAAFPPPLDSYQDQDMDGIAAVLGHRIVARDCPARLLELVLFRI